MARRRQTPQNKSAVIRQRETRSGKFHTETFGRDRDTLIARVSTESKSNSTELFISPSASDDSLSLNGFQARTLYRLLQKHYRELGKNW